MHVAWRYWRVITNPEPDWVRYGVIQLADFSRFEEGVAAVFPAAPARSYLSLGKKFTGCKGGTTEFYLRSAGKRGGVHRFRAEIRIPKDDEDKIPTAQALFEKAGMTVTRTEKSYGAVILETSDVQESDGLVACARQFAANVLDCPQGRGLAVSWHVAGAGAKE